MYVCLFLLIFSTNCIYILQDEHTLEWKEFYTRTNITTANAESGLSAKDAAKRLASNGPNVLTPPHQTPKFILFLQTLVAGFNVLLWIGGAAAILSYGLETTQKADADKSNVRLFKINIAKTLFLFLSALSRHCSIFCCDNNKLLSILSRRPIEQHNGRICKNGAAEMHGAFCTLIAVYKRVNCMFLGYTRRTTR